MADPSEEPSNDAKESRDRGADPLDTTTPRADLEAIVVSPDPVAPADSPTLEPAQTVNSIKPVAGDGQRATPPKKGKPDFASFIAEMETVVSGKTAKGSIARLMKLLKTGYSTRPTPDHLNQLFNLLQPWPECSRLALNLYIETRKKRSSELMRFIRNRLLAHAQVTIKYPGATNGQESASQESRAESLLTWIDGQVSHVVPENQSEHRPFDLPRMRWLLLSLMEEPAGPVRYAGIYGLLDRLAKRKSTSEGLQGELEFVSEIGGLFSTEKLNLQRVRSALRAADAARTIEQQCREELRRAKTLLDDNQRRSDNLSQVASDLERQLQESQRRLSEVEKLCDGKDRELAEQKNERQLDQEHWQEQCVQRLNKQASSIKTRLGHEISEAKLSLSQETPNVRFALIHLNNIDKALERLKDE